MLTRSEDVSQTTAGPRVPGSLNLVVRSGTFIPGVGTVKHLGILLSDGVAGAGGVLNDNGKSILFWATTTDGVSALMLAHPKL